MKKRFLAMIPLAVLIVVILLFQILAIGIYSADTERKQNNPRSASLRRL